MNPLVESHEDRLQGLQSDMGSVRADVAHVQADVGHIGENVTNLNAQMREMNERVAGMEARLEKQISDGFLSLETKLDPLRKQVQANERQVQDLVVKERVKVRKWKKLAAVATALLVAIIGAVSKSAAEYLLVKMNNGGGHP